MGLVILAIIYLLRPKYHNREVSSTYIWKLSLKYQKQKKRLEKLRQSLLLALQVLVLVSLTLLLARPYLMRPSNSEKIIILDLSASMQAKEGDTTRLAAGLAAIEELTEKTCEEYPTTLIVADEAPYVALRRSGSPAEVAEALESIVPAYGTTDLVTALELASAVLAAHPYAQVYLYTDRPYANPGYVQVENLSRGEWNAALVGFDGSIKGGFYEFRMDLVSYGKDANLTVTLSVDGEEIKTRTLRCQKDTPISLTLGKAEGVEVTSYDMAEARLVAEDAFAWDNGLTLFGTPRPRYVELVSEHPHLMSHALRSEPRCVVLSATLLPEPQIYTEGYDLYVYEHLLPRALPADGGLLLINPADSAFGFTLGETVEGSFTLTAPADLSGRGQAILGGLAPSEVELTAYRRILAYPRGFETVLSVGEDPLLMVGEMDGIPVAVLAMDLHYSTLPLQLEFPLLVGRLCASLAPLTVDSHLVGVGETVDVRPKPNCRQVTVEVSPKDGSAPTETVYTELPLSLSFECPASVTVTQTLSGGKVRTDRLEVRLDPSEGDFATPGDTLDLAAPDVPPKTGAEFMTDLAPYLALFLLLLLLVEWEVQYREAY